MTISIGDGRLPQFAAQARGDLGAELTDKGIDVGMLGHLLEHSDAPHLNRSAARVAFTGLMFNGAADAARMGKEGESAAMGTARLNAGELFTAASQTLFGAARPAEALDKAVPLATIRVAVSDVRQGLLMLLNAKEQDLAAAAKVLARR
jgi:hypothetical protein